MLLATAAVAQQTPPVPTKTPEMTAEQIAAVKARAKEHRRRTLHPEVEHVRGVTGGVSVGVRCGEGYVLQQHVVPSVQDVEIVATKRTECDGSRCRGLQVLARRSDGPF